MLGVGARLFWCDAVEPVAAELGAETLYVMGNHDAEALTALTGQPHPHARNNPATPRKLMT